MCLALLYFISNPVTAMAFPIFHVFRSPSMSVILQFYTYDFCFISLKILIPAGFHKIDKLFLDRKDTAFVNKHTGGTGASAGRQTNGGQDGLRLPCFTTDTMYSIIEI